MNLKDLSKPFPASDIEWRVGRCGTNNNQVWAMVLAYINARAVMDRLDDVVGIGNWKDRYWTEGKAVMCGLSIKIGDEWIEKIDGAEETDIEAVKGGLSSALKRAAVKWGIGRYLYNLEEGFAKIVDKNAKGATYAKTKEGTVFYWLPPELPKWALPEVPQPNTTEPVGNTESVAAKVSSVFRNVFEPAPVPVLVSDQFNDADLGAYKIPFGTHIGKRLDAFGAHDLDNWSKFIRKSAADKGKQLTGQYLEAIEKAEAFLKTREFKKVR